MANQHPVTWRLPAPLWSLTDAGTNATADERALRPAILRFRGLDFVDRLLDVLASAPADLRHFVVRAESRSNQGVGWEPDPDPDEDLVLFRPIHDRFYLVAASLVCAVFGLPERRPAPAEGDQPADRLSFVLRRLGSGGGEESWDGDRQRGTWRPVPDPSRPEITEQRQALFRAPFEQDGLRRTLWGGALPLAAAATYGEAGDVGDGEGSRSYVVRCLYERARCGVLDEPVLSPPSRPFRIAARLSETAPQWPVPAQRTNRPPGNLEQLEARLP